MAGYGKLVNQLRSERKGLQRRIEQLTVAINALRGNEGAHGRSQRRSAAGGRRRRRFSAATRRKMAAAQKARWAKLKLAKS
jgi:hypothetical protein